MNIQSNINQMMSLSALVMSQTPGVKAKQQEANIKRQIKTAKTAQRIAGAEYAEARKPLLQTNEEGVADFETTTEEQRNLPQYQTYQQTQQRVENLQGQLAEVAPSKKNIRTLNVMRARMSANEAGNLEQQRLNNTPPPPSTEDLNDNNGGI